MAPDGSGPRSVAPPYPMARPARTSSAARTVPRTRGKTVASHSSAKSNGKLPAKPVERTRALAAPRTPEPAALQPAAADPPARAERSVPPPAPPPRRLSVRPGPPPGIAIQVPPPAPAPDFRVGDKAVHPAHGVGEVTAIEEREIGGTRARFYILRILDNKVMVPISAATQVGLRGIMSDKEANNILQTMRAREVAVDAQPWSRRFRVYTEMIKSGSPVEIAQVLRDMNRLKFDKDLSFGERLLLDQARSLLLKELAFAKKKTEADMAEEIRRIFSA